MDGAGHVPALFISPPRNTKIGVGNQAQLRPPCIVEISHAIAEGSAVWRAMCGRLRVIDVDHADGGVGTANATAIMIGKKGADTVLQGV